MKCNQDTITIVCSNELLLKGPALHHRLKSREGTSLHVQSITSKQ